MTRSPGFSLAETLVAFAVLVAALLVILPALHTPVGAAQRQATRAMAEDFARSRLAAYGLLVPVSAGQRLSDDRSGWRTRETVEAVSFPGAATRLHRITIEVFDQSGRTRLARVDGLR